MRQGPVHPTEEAGMSPVWCGHPACAGGHRCSQESCPQGLRPPNPKLLPPPCDPRDVWAALWLPVTPLDPSLSPLSAVDGPLPQQSWPPSLNSHGLLPRAQVCGSPSRAGCPPEAGTRPSHSLTGGPGTPASRDKATPSGSPQSVHPFTQHEPLKRRGHGSAGDTWPGKS